MSVGQSSEQSIGQLAGLSAVDRIELTKLVNAVVLSEDALALFVVVPEGSPTHPIAQALWAQLTSEVEESLRFSTFDFSDNSLFNFLSLYEDETKPTRDLPVRDVIFAFGIERLPEPYKKQELKQLNISRERLFERNMIVVFWLDHETALNDFQYEAPDFWDWRAQIAVFKTQHPNRTIEPSVDVQRNELRHGAPSFQNQKNQSTVSASVYPKPTQKLPLDEQVTNIFLKVTTAVSLISGGAGAFLSLFEQNDVLKAVVSASIGVGLAYGANLLMPLRRIERRAAEVGEAVDRIAEAAIAKATRFEEKYLYCQAADCESVRSEGLRLRVGVFEPLLKDVFVELQIDRGTSSPGYEKRGTTLAGLERQGQQTIWDLLVIAKQQRVYRQLAILAWSGYGKTTLLKHVAYRYGIRDVPKDAPKLIPVLLVLRKYCKHLSQANPPSLPTLINQYHIPSLPEAYHLQPVPINWAEGILRRGQALVMLDGFDEVPRSERPVIAKWINEQMRQYAKSIFIVTSRPKGYKEQDAESQLRMGVELWVRPFNDVQRSKFIENWYVCQEKLRARRDTPEVRKVAANAASVLIEQVEQEPELAALAKNPLLLNMIATFHHSYPGGELPKRRGDLYEDIFRLFLKERPRARGLETVLLQIDPQPVLEQIALRMMQYIKKRINEKILLKELSQALDAQDESVDARDFLRDIVHISELVVQQDDEYEFAHFSFQEYLAAAYIAENPEERETLLFDNLGKDWWRSTILMYAGKTKKPANLIREAMRQEMHELAYECLQQTNRRVYESLQGQVQDARYADLDRYLQNGQWREADEETYRLMITEVGKEEREWFALEDIQNFPCKPLKIIDQLWVKFSGGKFGFSVQEKIYLECGGVADGQFYKESWRKFCTTNGWSGHIEFNIDSPAGHLPVAMADYLSLPSSRYRRDLFFSRTHTCEL